MEPKPGWEVTSGLRLETVPVRVDDLTTLLCLACRRPLDVHQPDAALPDRMLATCAYCKGWHVIERAPDGATALVALLPDLATLRAEEAARARAKRGRGTK